MSILPVMQGIGAAATGAGSLISAIANPLMQAETNKQNLALWREQTAYNTPLNQVKRLEAAGLNPALMYGKGSAANVAATAPGMSSPRIDAPDLSSPIAEYQQVVNAEAQHQNIISQNELLKQQARAEGVRADSAARDLKIREDLTAELGYPVQAGDDAKALMVLKGIHTLGNAGNMPVPKDYDRTKEGVFDYLLYGPRENRGSGPQKGSGSW